ncbi:MAG: benzoate-CoA ligase family protein [Actinomycetota bacterium]|nr:benzoate-CoA ligase family protein [Actinomycetota bacterium]
MTEPTTGGTTVGTYNAASWLVDRHVADDGAGRTALRCEGRSTSYGELQQEVWRVQHALTGLGVGAGGRVALVMVDDEALVAWFLGALRSGVVPVPLSTMLTGADLGAIVADAGATAAVVSAPFAGHVDEITRAAPDVTNVVIVGDEPSPGRGPGGGGGPVVHPWSSFDDRSEASVADTDADSPAFWLYSSGTTGTPKGVMHRHASLQATADHYARGVLEVGPGDRFHSIAKLFFAYGLGNSLTFPLSVGATSILNPNPPTPAAVAALVAAEHPTLLFASPGFVAGLLDAEVAPETFASVRTTVTAGESLPADLHRRYSERFGHPVLDGIGTTEALHIFLSNTKGATRAGTSGTPATGYEVRLLDENDAEVTDADTAGFLHVRGPSIATGYWRRPEATDAAFRDGWLRTGDVYTRSADGYWTFLGRNNDMIKAGGIWVSPAEVEAVLVAHPDVLEAAVVGGRDDEGLETTVAYVVARAGRTIDEGALERHCRERMAAFKRPRRLVVVDELPKTATGKIQRYVLRARESDHVGSR